jgi:hypothetical protein
MIKLVLIRSDRAWTVATVACIQGYSGIDAQLLPNHYIIFFPSSFILPTYYQLELSLVK